MIDYTNTIERRCSSFENYFTKPLIVYKISSEEALNFAKSIIKYLMDKEGIVNIFIEAEYSNKFLELNEKNNKNSSKLQKFDSEISQADLCITIGGDGTVLWSNYLFGLNKRPPFLTFNMGTLGYLAYYNCAIFQEILSLIFDNPTNEIIMEKRSTLVFNRTTKKEILLSKETGIYKNTGEGVALNDLVINRDSLRAIILDIYLNNNFMTTIRSDGIIVSTSTGSTAYSLSSGGSIVHYDVDCLLMSAICPHSLSFRPIVFPKDIRLQVLLNSHSPSKAHYCNDGINKYMIDLDEGVEVKVSDDYLNIIVIEKYLVSPLKLWMDKMVEQLGWNTSFKNIA